jgi:taurine dioxygenase
MPLSAEMLTVGHPLAGVTVQLLDDDGREVADGETGEITVESPSQAEGYWQEPILTRAVFKTSAESRIYLTGDLGQRRPDGSIIPSARFAEYWHHDGDFWAPGQNFIVNFLSSVRVPAVGGNTGFLDSRLAYEKLDLAQQAELAGAYICVRASEISDFKKAAPHEIPPDARHPVLRPHPLTGQIALYLPDSSTGIQKRDGQSWGTVESLIDASQQKLGIFEHVWSPGDLVIMDNLQVMHRGMGGYADHPRLLYRCQARVR